MAGAVDDRARGMNDTGRRICLLDASRLVIESLARAGADTFVGYPITPANLLYSYGFRRMPVALRPQRFPNGWDGTVWR